MADNSGSSVGDFFATLKIKLDESGINKVIKDIQSELASATGFVVNIKGDFDHLQIDRDLKVALGKLGNNVVKIKTVVDPVLQEAKKGAYKAKRLITESDGSVRMSTSEYLDAIASDKAARRADKLREIKQKQDQKAKDDLAKEIADDNRIILEDNIRRNKKYNDDKAKLLKEQEKFSVKSAKEAEKERRRNERVEQQSLREQWIIQKLNDKEVARAEKEALREKLQRLKDTDTIAGARASAELQANNQRLAKQRLVDRTIIKAADDFAAINIGMLPRSVKSLRDSIDNFNEMLSISGKDMPFASRSKLRGRSILGDDDINKAISILSDRLGNLDKTTKASVVKVPKTENVGALTEYLIRQSLQVEDGDRLASSQRAGGKRVLAKLRGKAESGDISVDTDFLNKYSEMLNKQYDLANAVRLSRAEKAMRTEMGLVSRDIDAGLLNTRMRNIQSRINQIESEIKGEAKRAEAIAKDRGISVDEARKSDRFKESLIGGPTINPRKVLQQLGSLEKDKLKLEESHALKTKELRQQIESSTSDAHKAALQRRLDATNRVFEQTYNAYKSLENNRAILTARAEELIQRRRESSLGSFIRSSRQAITSIRDMSNNLILPFVAMSGFQKAAQVIGGAEGVRAGLQAVIEDSKEAADMFKFLEGETERLSTKLTDVGNPFMRLISSTRTAGISDNVSKRLFTGVLESAIKFNLDNQSVGRVITALDQIASKGQVLSEELEYRFAA